MAHLSRVAGRVGIIAAAMFAAAPSYSACTSQDPSGTAMPPGTKPDRTVTLTTKTKRVAVQYGETVKFLVPSGEGPREVIWKFDGIADKVFLPDLNIPVYVKQNKIPLHSCYTVALVSNLDTATVRKW